MTRSGPYLADITDWRAWAVFRRNGKVYLRNWRTAFIPPAMEPVIFFLAFGLGLGAYVGSMVYDGGPVGYGTYVAPGMLAYAAFSTPFFEALYSSYVRMFYQKTWDGILATQVELHHIVWGEALWAGARATMNTAVVALVLAVLDLVGAIELHLWAVLVLLPVTFFFGWAIASFSLIFTAIVPSIDHMNYPVFLIGIPLGLVSNTYFPLDATSPIVSAIVQVNPVYHLAEGARALLVSGRFDLHLVWFVLTSAVLLLLCMTLAQRLTKRRVLGE